MSGVTRCLSLSDDASVHFLPRPGAAPLRLEGVSLRWGAAVAWTVLSCVCLLHISIKTQAYDVAKFSATVIGRESRVTSVKSVL